MLDFTQFPNLNSPYTTEIDVSDTAKSNIKLNWADEMDSTDSKGKSFVKITCFCSYASTFMREIEVESTIEEYNPM